MFTIDEELIKFKNIDLVKYINKKHQASDLVEIEAEKNAINSILKFVNEEALQFFLEKKDPLINLLEIHQNCYETIEKFNNNEKLQFDDENTARIHSKELEKKLELFVEDTTIFLTEERYFVDSETFNNDEVLCILTNDLLFVGEKISDGRFRLKRSISVECIRMEMNETQLKIILDGSHCDLTGKKEDVESFYESFQDISYKYREETDDGAKVDYDLILYYIQTRRYDELREYRKEVSIEDYKLTEMIINSRMTNLIDDGDSFASVVSLLQNPASFCKIFFTQKLKKSLVQVNKIQLMRPYLEDLFKFVENYILQLNEYFQRLSLNRSIFILIVEECYRLTIRYMEPRILSFMKNTSKSTEILDLIQTKLRIVTESVNLDFRYLIEEICLAKPVKKTDIEKSKEKIKNVIQDHLQGK